jgi:hypothetical protein
MAGRLVPVKNTISTCSYSSTNASYYIKFKSVLMKPVKFVIPPTYVHFPIHRKQTNNLTPNENLQMDLLFDILTNTVLQYLPGTRFFANVPI